MTYIAFLRGVNVGGKGIVSMAAIKKALVALGLHRGDQMNELT